jgi:peptide deformylase
VLKRVIIVSINGMQLELINPTIVAQEGNECGQEGCLSIKGMQGYVNRPYKVTVNAQDRMGMSFTITGVKDLARCLCHEIDHTNGILFTDKTVPAPKEEE